MLRLCRWLWKVFILASVFGIGYIIGREHSFEEDEDWEDDNDLSTDKKEENTEEEKKNDANKGESQSDRKPEKSNPADGARVTFEYSGESATHVAVVGPFNDWNKDSHILKNENGIWKTEISLPKGRAEYKFVVNHTDWIADPKCPETIPDKHGGRSSVVQVS